MSRIAGLRKETEVGKFKALNHLLLLCKKLDGSLSPNGGVSKHQENEDNVDEHIDEEKG